MSTTDGVQTARANRLPIQRAPGEPIVVDGVTFTIRGAAVSMNNNVGSLSGQELIGLQPTPSSPFDVIDHWTLSHRKNDGEWEDVAVYCATSDYDHRLDGTYVPVKVIQ